MVNRKTVKNVGQIKVVDTGLEGFMDLVDLISTVEGREDDMSNFAACDPGRMRLQAKGSRQAGADFTTSSKALCDP